MLAWLKTIVNLGPREQLAAIEQREPSLEERLERLIGRLGTYSRRTANELDEIMADLEKVLDIVERMIIALEHIGGAERARNLRKRFRNHQTRARRARRAFETLSGSANEPAA